MQRRVWVLHFLWALSSLVWIAARMTKPLLFILVSIFSFQPALKGHTLSQKKVSVEIIQSTPQYLAEFIFHHCSVLHVGGQQGKTRKQQTEMEDASCCMWNVENMFWISKLLFVPSCSLSCFFCFFWLQHGSSGFSHFSSSSPPLLHITVPVAYYRGNHMHTCFHKRFSFFLSVSVVLLPISFIKKKKKKKLAKQSPRQQAAVVRSCPSVEARHIYGRCCTFWVAGARRQSI